MGLTRKDLAAGALTVLAVLAFVAADAGWGVWLVGGSHRWAAVAVTVLGGLACGEGSPGRDRATWMLGALGVAAGGLALAAIVSGSLLVLSVLTIDVVLLWVGALLRHVGVAAGAEA